MDEKCNIEAHVMLSAHAKNVCELFAKEYDRGFQAGIDHACATFERVVKNVTKPIDNTTHDLKQS